MLFAVIVIAVTVLPPAAPAAAFEETPEATEAAAPPRVPVNQVRRIKVTRRMTFPIVFPTSYGSSFGYCRDGCLREHHGVDIFTFRWKGAPVVAAHSGRIVRAGVGTGNAGCHVWIQAADGWVTRYLHLNDDTPGYDDESYSCLPSGIEIGALVEEGQLIGWIGDSGNAETTPAHLHFELRTPRGYPVDPYRSLRRAKKIRFTKLDEAEPIDVAATISQYAYPDGARVVFLTTVGADARDTLSVPAGGRLDGPLLVTGVDGIPEATVAELDRLAPQRIVILERGETVSTTVEAELRRRARIVERFPFPVAEEADPITPDGPSIGRAGGAEPSFWVVLMVAEPPADEAGRRWEALTWSVPTMYLDSDADAPRRRGRSPYSGPGRSGRRRTLYFADGAGYTRFPATEAPAEPPGPGVVFVAPHEATAPTFAFLRSLAAVPAMPLWR